MKKRFFLLPLLLTGILIAVQYGCEGDTGEVCEDFKPPEGCNAAENAMVCCSDTSCYYIYRGIEYPGTDEGREALLEDMCGTSFNTRGCVITLEERTKALMKEARECARCN